MSASSREEVSIARRVASGEDKLSMMVAGKTIRNAV
jgi:hypothetical protein